MISSNSHRGRGEAWGISVGNVLFLAVVYFQIFVGGEPSLPLKQDRGLLTTFGSADELVSYERSRGRLFPYSTERDCRLP